jgi:hypothetical protein
MTSPVYSEISHTNNFVTDSVSIAMQRIFETPDISQLDLAVGLKQLLQEKHYDLDFLLQSNAATVADQLGIENYVGQIIIDAARRATIK